MDFYRRICSVMAINFRRWKNDKRVLIIFIVTAMLLAKELGGLTEYGLVSAKKCTINLLPLLFCGEIISVGSMKTYLYLGLLLLLCDAPFLYPTVPYMLLRSKRECWWMGECLYMLMVTFLYIAFITAVSMIAVIPVATYKNIWGSVMEDMAFGTTQQLAYEIQNQYEIYVGVPEHTIAYLYPVGAQVYTFFAAWASFFFLALVQYLISLISKSMFLGFAAAGIFVFLDPVLTQLSYTGSWVQALSPVCWSSTEFLAIANSRRFLTIPFVGIMLTVLILLLMLMIRQISKKITIEIVARE